MHGIATAVLLAAVTAGAAAPGEGTPGQRPGRSLSLRPVPSASPTARARPPAAGAWTPLPEFTDEFEGDRLDPARWHDHNPTWKGRKPALFRPSNVKVAGGRLRLTMRCEDVPDAPRGYHTFTSAAVKSRTTVRYGYFEIRARAMNSRGSSAFWFSGGTPEWRTEIDVFEIGGAAPSHRRALHMNVHVFRTPTEKRHWSKAETYTTAADLADAFHTYGLLWTPETVAWYFDGRPVRTIKNTHWHQPLYMDFDSETMPHWFGLPEKRNLPATFSIEYVRSWKRAEPKTPAIERPLSEADRGALDRLAGILEVTHAERIAGPGYVQLGGKAAALTATCRETDWRVKEEYQRQSAAPQAARVGEYMQRPPAERLRYMDRIRNHTQVWLVPLADHPDAGPDLKRHIPPNRLPHEHVREVACMGRGHGYAWFAWAPVYRWVWLADELDLAGGDDRLAACVRGTLVEDPGRCTANSCLGRLGEAGPRALPYVEAAVADRHPARRSLVRCLYHSDDPAVARWLIDHARSADPEVAAGVRSALRARPIPEAGPLYLAWLEESIGGDGAADRLAACRKAGVAVPMGLLERIMASPAHLREYALAFRMARAEAGRPVPEALREARECIIGESFACVRQNAEYDRDAVERATRTLLASDDHEAVAVTGVVLATYSNKCRIEIPRRAGRRVLRHLPDGRGRKLVDRLRRTCRSATSRRRLEALAKALAEGG